MSDVALDDFEDLAELDEEFDEPPPLAEAIQPVTVEARARAMGWKPLPADPRNPQPNEFRGDPRLHRGAAEFIAHGEEQLPVLRDNNRRMSERLARIEPEMETLRNTIAQQDAAIQRATTLALRADEEGYKRGLAALKDQRREAMRAGDEEAVDQVQEQIDTLVQARASEAAPPPVEAAPAPTREEMWPETRAFLADNPWMQTDPVLSQAMVSAHNAVLNLYPTMDRAEQFERAKRQVMDAHPAKFPQAYDPEPEDEDIPLAREPEPAPRPRAAPRAAVMAPSAPQGAPQGRRSVWERIPEDERAEARQGYEYARKGDPDMPASEYVDLYINPKLNPLELRARRKKA